MLRPDRWQISVRFFAVSCLLTFLLRVYLCRLGSNFDYDSFNLVGDLMVKGKNVYASTDRYNYAPVWMWVLYFLKLVSGSHFRYGLSAFISLVDVAIAGVLFQRGNRMAALLILFSPVCIIISGFHCQFDNLAILIGLVAVRYAETRKSYKVAGLAGLNTREIMILAFIVGFSITTKHVLIFFPFWFLFIRDIKFFRRILLCGLPLAVFMLSFLPYLSAWHDIKENVFKYGSSGNLVFYHLFLPDALNSVLLFISLKLYKLIFIFLMIFSGYFLRSRVFMEQLLFYCAFMVLFSCSLYTHYLIIPMLFFAYFPNRFWIWYNLVGLFFFLIQHDQFNYASKLYQVLPRTSDFIELYTYYPLVFILFLAVVNVCRPDLLSRRSLKRAAGFIYRSKI